MPCGGGAHRGGHWQSPSESCSPQRRPGAAQALSLSPTAHASSYRVKRLALSSHSCADSGHSCDLLRRWLSSGALLASHGPAGRSAPAVPGGVTQLYVRRQVEPTVRESLHQSGRALHQGGDDNGAGGAPLHHPSCRHAGPDVPSHHSHDPHSAADRHWERRHSCYGIHRGSTLGRSPRDRRNRAGYNRGASRTQTRFDYDRTHRSLTLRSRVSGHHPL